MDLLNQASRNNNFIKKQQYLSTYRKLLRIEYTEIIKITSKRIKDNKTRKQEIKIEKSNHSKQECKISETAVRENTVRVKK